MIPGNDGYIPSTKLLKFYSCKTYTTAATEAATAAAAYTHLNFVNVTQILAEMVIYRKFNPQTTNFFSHLHLFFFSESVVNFSVNFM